MFTKPISFWDNQSKDVVKCLNMARAYYKSNTNYVNELVQNASSVCPPSDLLRPEVWQGSHWTWYLNVIVMKG